MQQYKIERFTQASLASALWKSGQAPQWAGPATGQPALGRAILPLCSTHPEHHGQFWAHPYTKNMDTLERSPAEATRIVRSWRRCRWSTPRNLSRSSDRPLLTLSLTKNNFRWFSNQANIGVSLLRRWSAHSVKHTKQPSGTRGQPAAALWRLGGSSGHRPRGASATGFTQPKPAALFSNALPDR